MHVANMRRTWFSVIMSATNTTWLLYDVRPLRQGGLRTPRAIILNSSVVRIVFDRNTYTNGNTKNKNAVFFWLGIDRGRFVSVFARSDSYHPRDDKPTLIPVSSQVTDNRGWNRYLLLLFFFCCLTSVLICLVRTREPVKARKTRSIV